MSVTLDVSQLERSPLKACAKENIAYMSVTLDVSQSETGSLKLLALWNKLRKLRTSWVAQQYMCPWFCSAVTELLCHWSDALWMAESVKTVLTPPQAIGDRVGVGVGLNVGGVGLPVGTGVGLNVGGVGLPVGTGVGDSVGLAVGSKIVS